MTFNKVSTGKTPGTPKIAESSCAYHPTCKITCVCISARCIMPLCHNCLDTHLQLHQKRNFKSQLVPVSQCLSNAQQSLQNLIQPLEFYRQKAQALTRDKMARLADTLVNVRDRLIQEITRQFDSYTAKVLQEHRVAEQRTRTDVEQLILELESKMLHLQLSDSAMKTFIELFLNEEETHKRVRQISKATELIPVATLTKQPINFAKWVSVSQRKMEMSKERSLLMENNSSLHSSIDDSIEQRIAHLKIQNEELLRVLKHE